MCRLSLREEQKNRKENQKDIATFVLIEKNIKKEEIISYLCKENMERNISKIAE